VTPRSFERASTLAWTNARVQLHHLGVDPDEASLFQRLAAHVFYIARLAAIQTRCGATGRV
jgi:cyclic beta-1,2-glucan synthetase